MKDQISDIEMLLSDAKEAFEQGLYDIADSNCHKVLLGFPLDCRARMLLAETSRIRGKLQDAEYHYRQLLAADPTHALGWAGLATLLFEQLRFGECSAALLHAKSIDPTLPEALIVEAMLLERSGAFTEADHIIESLHPSHRAPHTPSSALQLTDSIALINDAIESLELGHRSWVSSLNIEFRAIPDEMVCRQYDPPLSPTNIVVALVSPLPGLPPSLLLFERNLGRVPVNERAQCLADCLQGEIDSFFDLLEMDAAASVVWIG